VRHGRVRAVDDLSFSARPGQVTALLGRNGAGKTSTLRVLVGVADPDRGTALIGGRRYRALRRPLHEVGAVLDAGAADGGRTAADHLRCLARSNGIGRARVGEVLERVGLGAVGGRRVARLSLGMRQRLGLAAALLGDPPVLVLDEPATGLDPQGIRWVHDLLGELAAAGRTVLVSSHLIGELGRVCDRVVVVERGRLVADATPDELVDRHDRGVRVRAADPRRLATALRSAGATVRAEDGALTTRGIGTATIGEIACAQRIPLIELTPRRPALEEAFLRLTARRPA
jgi:ABC-2 type transport system ATP-binding protein